MLIRVFQWEIMMDVELEQRTKVKLQPPQLYKVVLLNDDFTPMEFVVDILKKVFNKNTDEANVIMLRVHHEGSCPVIVTTKEIADQKATEVRRLARSNGHPLRCRAEVA